MFLGIVARWGPQHRQNLAPTALADGLLAADGLEGAAGVFSAHVPVVLLPLQLQGQEAEGLENGREGGKTSPTPS